MKLSSIERIHSFKAHSNAETLECASVLSWPVVVKKNQFKDGELIVFIFPDVLVDKENPYFLFMESRKWKVWMAKFRGEPSCGLVCPLSILDYYGVDKNTVVEGQDISDTIKCIKYVKDTDAISDAEAKGLFPSGLISKTDEDNALSNPATMQEFGRVGEVYLTKKMDGQSFSFISNNGEIDVCSRSLSKRDGNNKWWNLARKYNLPEKFKSMNIAIQGESCGNGIQKNKMGLSENEMFVFNVKDLNTMTYYGYNELNKFCECFNLKMVPLISVLPKCPSLNELLTIANSLKYDNGNACEGLVVRPVIPCYSYSLRKMLSLKVLNLNYKD